MTSGCRIITAPIPLPRSRQALYLILAILLLLPLQSQPATLKIATLAPDGTSWMKAMRSGAREIAERTEGRVKLRFYPGGVMGNDRSVLRKIRIGQLHGGAVTVGSLIPIYPDIQIYSLPFLFSSFGEVDYIRQRMDPIIIFGLRERGFISYGLSEGGFAYLMSQAPLLSVEDLRRQKVWSPEGDIVAYAAFEAIGVSPIPLPLTDVLTGLQTGLINTVVNSPIATIALQWHTRVNHFADIPLLYLYGTLVIKERALHKLSTQDRAILKEVMEERFQQINGQSRRDNLNAQEALKRQGITFNSPSRDQMTEWRMYINQAIKKLRNRNGFSIKLLEKLQDHLETFRARKQ